MQHERSSAVDLAVQALAFIAGDAGLGRDFMEASGLRVEDLRRAFDDPDFAAAVLDFIVGNDTRVVDFARHAGVAPAAIMRARTALAGPGSEGWAAD